MPKTVIIVDDSKFLIKQIVEFFEKQLDFEVLGTGNDGLLRMIQRNIGASIN